MIFMRQYLSTTCLDPTYFCQSRGRLKCIVGGDATLATRSIYIRDDGQYHWCRNIYMIYMKMNSHTSLLVVVSVRYYTTRRIKYCRYIPYREHRTKDWFGADTIFNDRINAISGFNHQFKYIISLILLRRTASSLYIFCPYQRWIFIVKHAVLFAHS